MTPNVFVYISGPITPRNGRSVEQNVLDGLGAHLRLLNAGIPNFCPHLSAAFPSAHSEVPYETWMSYDLAVIDRCSHVLMLPTHAGSAGAARELAYAIARGVPVAYSEAELMGMIR